MVDTADPRWICLVTYADEWRGHTGHIYRAAGWTYEGRTKPERTYVIGGRMTARKAGGVTRTDAEMRSLGAECVGAYARHKFTLIRRAQVAARSVPAPQELPFESADAV